MAHVHGVTRRTLVRIACLAPVLAACAAPVASAARPAPASPAQLPTLIEFYADT